MIFWCRLALFDDCGNKEAYILDSGGYGNHEGYKRLLSHPTGSVELGVVL